MFRFTILLLHHFHKADKTNKVVTNNEAAAIAASDPKGKKTNKW